jgi:hypothetical protein
MKYKNTIKLRLPEIQLLAVVPTQLKFSIVKDHDEPTILLVIIMNSFVLTRKGKRGKGRK